MRLFDALSRLACATVLLGVLGGCDGGGGDPVPSAAALRGNAVFVQNCAHCHIATNNRSQDAPSLYNIIGRKAGTTSFPNSTALRQAGLVWDRKTLDRFLADPRRVVPGNQMAFFGMPDAALRSDLIAYLEANSPAAAGR